MTIYIIMLILSVLSMYSYDKYFSRLSFRICVTMRQFHVKFIHNLWMILPMLPMAIVGGIRYGVGQDYFYTYVPIFKKLLIGSSEDIWGEAGYILLNKLVQLFTDDYAGIFIVTSFIFAFFIINSIIENSNNKCFSIYLVICSGYYFCSLNGIRQMLAASILLYAIKFIVNRDKTKFMLLVILASTIHLSSLIFIPIYFLSCLKLKNFHRILITIVTFVFAGPLSSLLTRLLILTKYGWYFAAEGYKAEREGVVMILMNICILIYACILNKDEKNDLWIDIQMVAVCITAFIGKIPVATRFIWYFGLPSIILIPNILMQLEDKKVKIVIKIMLAILYFIYFYYTLGIKNSNSVLPYQTIFSR